ncbi:MAG: XDD4 family exosortase-dependent surface protein [Planctomycetaceae bacterium]
MFLASSPRRAQVTVAAALASLVLVALGPPASATVVVSGSGTSVNPISAMAIFTFGTGTAANNLDITLINTSTVPTRYPSDVLTSLYFDIKAVSMSGTTRPTLVYEGASGQVFQVKSGTGNDVAYRFTTPYTSGTSAFTLGTGTSNLKAANNGDYTWQYKAMNSGSAPFYGFGVGTVGNSTSGTTGYVWAPNNFDGQKVGQLEFGIYNGESPTLQNQLENQYLVNGWASFRFSGVFPFTEANLSRDVMFGFGTSPDAVIELPEPGGLAACGLLAAAVFGGLVRPRGPRGLWLACGFAAVAIACLLALPGAEAAPIMVDDAFDFSAGPLGWTGTPVGKNGFLPPSDPAKGARWTHGSGHWSVNWAPVSGPLVATGNWLTSGTIDASDQIEAVTGNRLIDAIRISIGHAFNFGSFAGSVPPAAGQVAYSINGGAYLPIPAAAWETGSVLAPTPPDPFGASPLWPDHVDQTTLVAPSFTPPVGSYADLFPLLNGGAAFSGATPGYTPTGGSFMPSVAVINVPLQEIDVFRVRLINANLGSSCVTGAGWDVGYLQVDFAAPEPAGLAMAGCGGLAALGAVARRQRPSGSVTA